jgi:hypothetical protein
MKGNACVKGIFSQLLDASPIYDINYLKPNAVDSVLTNPDS